MEIHFSLCTKWGLQPKFRLTTPLKSGTFYFYLGIRTIFLSVQENERSDFLVEKVRFQGFNFLSLSQIRICRLPLPHPPPIQKFIEFIFKICSIFLNSLIKTFFSNWLLIQSNFSVSGEIRRGLQASNFIMGIKLFDGCSKLEATCLSFTYIFRN